MTSLAEALRRLLGKQGLSGREALHKGQERAVRTDLERR